MTHDFSINLGFAALKSNYQLLDRVDEIIETLIDDGDIEAIFAEHELSYRAPSAPLLMPPLSSPAAYASMTPNDIFFKKNPLNREFTL